jgi:hypothetical protein
MLSDHRAGRIIRYVDDYRLLSFPFTAKSRLLGRFRLEMNERLVIGSRCCLNLTPTFASGDSVVARVLRGTKVSYGRSPECSPAIAAAAAAHCATRPRQRDRRRSERSAAQVPAGSAVQLCNDLLEDRMHEEVWREVYPQFLTFKILVPWVKSTATSTKAE